VSGTVPAHPRWTRDGMDVDCDPARLDLDVIHGFLTEVYWAAGRSRHGIERAIAGATNFGLYETASGAMIGYGRVVSDHVTFAWMTDVFVLEGWRGRGLGTFLVECMMEHPTLGAETVSWNLGTRDGKALYAKFGFEETAPGHIMRRRRSRES
jgi:GNAT superfamily N-acetyltransferase